MSPEQKLAIFEQHPFFSGLSRPDLEKIVRHARLVAYAKGRAIFRKGDPGHGLLAVVRGSVKISLPSHEGREVVLSLMRDGDIFGEIALLDGQPRSADAVAIADSEVLVLDRRDVLPVLWETAALAQKIVELLCARLRRTNDQVEYLSALNLPSRLAKVLLRLSGPGGRAPVEITQKQLGEFIGMSRESTNKQLRAWQDQGFVQLEKGRVVITNPAALADLAAD